MKVDMIITNSETGSFEEEYCDFVRLNDVNEEDMMMIMRYSHSSGYDVCIKKSEGQD